MGLTDPSLTEAEGHDYDGLASTSPRQQQNSLPLVPAQYAKDPLWSIGKDEAIRLCRVYDEEIGMMYPMLDIEQIIDKADKTFAFAGAAAKTALVDRSKSSLDSQDVNILKMILATVLTLEGGGQSELGLTLFETVRGACESKLGAPPDIGGLRLLVIMAQFRFQQGAEIQAYRTIGLAARLSFEMGLHRNNALHRDFANHEERSWALKTFWSIFVLDRRWSFGAGLPFAIQDGDIDPLLPEPVRIVGLLKPANGLMNLTGRLYAVSNCNDSIRPYRVQGVAVHHGSGRHGRRRRDTGRYDGLP